MRIYEPLTLPCNLNSSSMHKMLMLSRCASAPFYLVVWKWFHGALHFHPKHIPVLAPTFLTMYICISEMDMWSKYVRGRCTWWDRMYVCHKAEAEIQGGLEIPIVSISAQVTWHSFWLLFFVLLPWLTEKKKDLIHQKEAKRERWMDGCAEPHEKEGDGRLPSSLQAPSHGGRL